MKSKYLILLSIIISTSCEEKISDFQAQNFTKFFGSGAETKGNYVIALPDGNFVITGYDKINNNNQVFAAKVNKYGNTIWSNNWGNSNNEIGKKITALYDSENNVTAYLILGNTLTSEGKTHSFLMKINQHGDKDSLWYYESGGSNYNLILNDFVVSPDGNYIYSVGESYQNEGSLSDRFVLKLNQEGDSLTGGRLAGPGYNDNFKRAFFNSSGNLLFIWDKNSELYIEEYDQDNLMISNGSIIFDANTGKTLLDAQYSNGFLTLIYNLSNNLNIIKLDDQVNPIWQKTITSSVSNCKMAFISDESIIISGESGGITSFFQVDDLGTTAEVYQGEEFFRTISGYVNCMIKTNDKGLIMVGTTPSTYGTMAQLIKTDKDLYLLKP